MAQNIRGAYIMLEAIKRDGKNNIKVTTPSSKNEILQVFISDCLWNF